jgi:hypothetical protein
METTDRLEMCLHGQYGQRGQYFANLTYRKATVYQVERDMK